VRRNKGPVLAASLVLLALTGGIIATTLALFEAWHQERLARSAEANEAEARMRESERAEAEATERKRASAAEAEAKKQEKEARDQLAVSSTVIDFLLDDLLAQAGTTAQANRRFDPDPNLTVREALDRSAAAVGEKFKNRPKLEAILRSTVGSAHRELGEYDKAVAQIQRATDILARVVGPKDPETLRAMHELAIAYRGAGRMDDAIKLYEEVHTAQMVNPGPEHPDTLTTLNNLATAYMETRRTAEAETLLEQVRDARLKVLGPEDAATLTTLHNLADVYRRTGRLTQAVELYEEVRAARVKVLSPDHPELLYTLNNLATTYWQLKQLDKSVPLFEQLLQTHQRMLGDRHPRTLRVRANLGVNYRDAGRLEEAIPLLEEVHRKGQKYPSLRWVGRELLLAYARTANSEDARALAKSVEAEARKTLQANSPSLAGELSIIGSALLDVREWSDAEAILRDSLAIREKHEPEAWKTFNTKSRLGGALLGQQKYADAEPLLLQGCAGMQEHKAQMALNDKVCLTQALERLVQLYDAWGKQAEANKYRKELAAEEARQQK
jgi:tetratricopeptide (TPR) repeat protein